MKIRRSHILNVIPREEWCARFVAAWTAFELPGKRAPLAEAHAAYEVAGMLRKAAPPSSVALVKTSWRILTSSAAKAAMRCGQ